MKVVRTAQEMLVISREFQRNGEVISLVPTMGALHQGHVSLFNQAKNQSSKLVVSVFVNPTQFNNPSDLMNYPRTFEADREILREVGVDVMFFPSEAEVYPSSVSVEYDLDGLDARMEGPNRPGHFNGVVQVVTRLFDLVNPSVAFFGEKDFQQLAIIRHMSRKLHYSVEIVGCETVREPSGLALSSRNVRLTPIGKELAIGLSACLFLIKVEIGKGIKISEVLIKAKEQLTGLEGVTLEYLELVDPQSLHMATDDSGSIQACLAAYVEGVRLIDNLKVK